MRYLFIVVILLESSVVYAESIQIKEISDSVKSLCNAPSEGTSSHYKITAEGDSTLRVKFLGKIGGEAKFEKEEWEGVQKVLRKDLANDKKNYRECVRELTPIFIKNFIKEEPKTSKNQQTHESQAQMSCDDVKMGTENYHDNMFKLEKLAGFSNSYNRNHESAISDLCEGDFEGVNFWTNNGYIGIKDIDEAAKVLGISYYSKLRTEKGLRYDSARKKLIDLGLSFANAGNIAQFYSSAPSSYCGELIKQAIDGDKEALEKLYDYNSEICTRLK